jgi:hypothetical protein
MGVFAVWSCSREEPRPHRGEGETMSGQKIIDGLNEAREYAILMSYRKRVGRQAALSFMEGVKFIQGDGAETKYVLAAAQRHLASVLAEFDKGGVGEEGERE